eukprot:TRINITY_DN75031_c0_g1_i1.p1 TRINITY_DN75031_c0_g1~~TRINITY_DN75031_c0_g1_i1.p1  ORF type:complete len:222 (-),score=60.52 TRINITY_DN75031_c0_g1_i1:63-728(-)
MSVDLDAIRKRLEASKLEAPAAQAEAPADSRGPLRGAWLDGTRFGEVGTPVEACGKWLHANWDKVNASPPEESGVLGDSPACEAEGGPPNRVAQVQELEAAAPQGELDCPRESALHCAFFLLFWLHQETIAFDPNLSIGAAGQSTKGSAESHFKVMIKAANLAGQLCRDVRNNVFARYGVEKRGMKSVSSYARSAAEEARKHSAALKDHINAIMADGIGIS